MNKYTASQVREAIESFSACDIGGELMAIAEDYIDLLRERESAEPVAWMTHHDEPMLFPTEWECVEYCADDERPIPLYTHPKRESAKARVTSQMRATACDAYDKEMVGHGETVNPVAMRAALEAVAPMLASARVPDSDAFGRGFVRGYEGGLGAAAAECRRQAGALDHAGNEYTRYADAIKCAAAISTLRPPELNEPSGNSGELPIYQYRYMSLREQGVGDCESHPGWIDCSRQEFDRYSTYSECLTRAVYLAAATKPETEE